MSINNLLLWEKYRPRTLDDIILLPRIRNYFKDGEVDGNYIFHGDFGTGKTSLARILIGKYSKNKAYLEVNTSLDTSINNLRNEIENFCKYVPMMETESDIKYVFLDEYERASPEFQDGFKAFIEKYNSNVRFIISTNHLNKIEAGNKSRISKINFNCQNTEEEKYLKQEIYKRIMNVILPKEGVTMTKENLVPIITKKFPDFREILVEVQDFLKTGNEVATTANVTNKLKLDLYNIIYDKSADYEKIYHFLMSNFGADRIDVMISLLGKQFVDWSILERKNADKLFECNYIIADYTSKLETATDPIILGLTIVGKFRDILIG